MTTVVAQPCRDLRVAGLPQRAHRTAAQDRQDVRPLPTPERAAIFAERFIEHIMQPILALQE